METKESQKQEWDDEDVIDVGEILYALLRKLWIIIGALVIGGAIGGAYKVPATGGEAQRLTSYVGYEMFPRFSPDGKTIAFTGQYDGNT